MTEYNDNDATLAPPQKCDACGFAGVVFAANAAIYGPRCVAPDDFGYHCKRCKASVGVHRGTVLPLGYMADAKTRALRGRAHSEFDPIWRYGRISRGKAYELLAEHLGVPHGTCHFGRLTKDQLVAAINFAREYLSEENKIKQRRDAKRNVKRNERAARDAKLARRKRDEQRKRSGGRYYPD